MNNPKVILVLGAGRSSSSLIAHLLTQASTENWEIHVGDLDVKAAKDKVESHAHGHAFEMSSDEKGDRDRRIAEADLVVSIQLDMKASGYG